DVILVARDRERLTAVAEEMKKLGVGADVITSDLASDAAPAALFAEVNQRGRQVEVLVNNAGFGAIGPFQQVERQRQLGMIQVNVTAVVELTHLFLPAMVGRKSGGVLNVASTAAFQPGPYMAIYYATKAFVLSFTEAIAEELAGRGVKISCLCPGPTHSEFAARADMQGTPLFKGQVMTSEDVAARGYQGWAA